MPAKSGPLRPHEERASYARPLPREPLPGEPELGDSFLIVTEGDVTERMYFDSIRKLNRAKVMVVHPPCTDALGLIEMAKSLRDKTGDRDNPGYDHVWVLFDTDVPSRDGKLGAAMAMALQEGIHVGHSTPSVETWLYLHFRDRPGAFMDSDRAERAVSEAWRESYDKSAETFGRLWPDLQPNISAAVRRAMEVRRYHQNSGTPFPANPSTEVDLLVRALDVSVRRERRIIR